MAKLSLEGFRNFFKYYTDEPHQKAAVEELYNNIDADLLEESADWIKLYRTPSDLPTIDLQVANPLPVPISISWIMHLVLATECFIELCDGRDVLRQGP